eukprot:TRINITY_DN66675_c7_g2_i1.p1 TRINITY_DN66675_c7_g2~~TRINITY_DN66675_c7_g2_i1.p1  ORF type:complete len:372 (-),score=33.30 TRINITY_DN66675_c7_g2_i1:110-1225(-)
MPANGHHWKKIQKMTTQACKLLQVGDPDDLQLVGLAGTIASIYLSLMGEHKGTHKLKEIVPEHFHQYFKLSARTLTTLITCCNRNPNDMQRFENLWERTSQLESRDVALYGAAITFCCYAKDSARATELWNQMLEDGLEPDEKAWCSLVRCYRATHDSKKIEAIWQFLKSPECIRRYQLGPHFFKSILFWYFYEHDFAEAGELDDLADPQQIQANDEDTESPVWRSTKPRLPARDHVCMDTILDMCNIIWENKIVINPSLCSLLLEVYDFYPGKISSVSLLQAMERSSIRKGAVYNSLWDKIETYLGEHPFSRLGHADRQETLDPAYGKKSAKLFGELLANTKQRKTQFTEEAEEVTSRWAAQQRRKLMKR